MRYREQRSRCSGHRTGVQGDSETEELHVGAPVLPSLNPPGLVWWFPLLTQGQG